MTTKVTQLRYVKSKNPDLLVEYANKLIGYKIEIKGAPVYAKGAWYLWFVLPEDLMKELPSGNLD